MDYHAFDKLSYGLYIVSSRSRRKSGGLHRQHTGQVTVSPVQVAVTINKENQTTRTILESGKFSATVLAESASMELIGRFGFQCSRDVDKFAEMHLTPGKAERLQYAPTIEESPVNIECRVTEVKELGTHHMFLAEVLGVTVDEAT